MVVQIIIIVVIIVLGLYVIGIGTDFLQDIAGSFEEKAKKQAEVTGESTEVSEVFAKANLAKDTGTRICDLEIIFVGDMTDFETGLNLQGGPESFLGFNRFIYFGEPTDFFSGLINPTVPSDRRTFDHTWFCDSAPVTTTSTSASTTGTTGTTTNVAPGSTGGGEICRTAARGIVVCETLSIFNLLSWNLIKNTEAGLEQANLSLLGERTSGENIRVSFIGHSLDRPNFNLYTPDFADQGIEEAPFTKSTNIGSGAEFPVNYRIKLNLDDVTEDSYQIEFWYEKFPANNEPVATHFFKNLCRPGASSC